MDSESITRIKVLDTICPKCNTNYRTNIDIKNTKAGQRIRCHFCNEYDYVYNFFKHLIEKD